MADINGNTAALLEMIDIVPPKYRQWDNDIIGYHLTTTDNADNIRRDGLMAHGSHQSYVRPECVYVFLTQDIDARNVPVLLGDVVQYAIITVKIPKTEIGKLKFDGLYNVSFDFGYGAAMYFDNIPAAWIENIKIENAPTIR